MADRQANRGCTSWEWIRAWDRRSVSPEMTEALVALFAQPLTIAEVRLDRAVTYSEVDAALKRDGM